MQGLDVLKAKRVYSVDDESRYVMAFRFILTLSLAGTVCDAGIYRVVGPLVNRTDSVWLSRRWWMAPIASGSTLRRHRWRRVSFLCLLVARTPTNKKTFVWMGKEKEKKKIRRRREGEERREVAHTISNETLEIEQKTKYLFILFFSSNVSTKRDSNSFDRFFHAGSNCI